MTSRILTRAATEAEMQVGFADVTKYKGGRIWHINDARNCPEMVDFWDTTILVPGLLVCLELKSATRRFEAGQVEVAELLGTVRRVVTGVCRPNPRPGEYSYDDVLEYLRGDWV